MVSVNQSSATGSPFRMLANDTIAAEWSAIPYLLGEHVKREEDTRLGPAVEGVIFHKRELSPEEQQKLESAGPILSIIWFLSREVSMSTMRARLHLGYGMERSTIFRRSQDARQYVGVATSKATFLLFYCSHSGMTLPPGERSNNRLA